MKLEIRKLPLNLKLPFVTYSLLLFSPRKYDVFLIAKIEKLGDYGFDTSAVLADGQSPGYRWSPFQVKCWNYAFSLASVLVQLREYPTIPAHGATMVRLWMHQPKRLNTTDICLTGVRGWMLAEFMRTRLSRALPSCAGSRDQPVAQPWELVCGRLYGHLTSRVTSPLWSP